MQGDYDVIVVGGGHAGCEAAAAAARMGSKVLLISMNMQTIAQMSCNPAMGGVAKGQIVREIDAMGGYSGIVSDLTAIQFRMLNRSKGPAMWSPRTQNDRMMFAAAWRQMLEETEGVHFWQDSVVALKLSTDGRKVEGVQTAMGTRFMSKAVVLTTGTFMNGLMHVGEKQQKGGRSGEHASYGISEQLLSLGFVTGRMKTGTPPRIDGRSLDYTKMEEQRGDEHPGKFSFTDTRPLQRQRSCWITYTNEEVHDLLRTGFDRSPMYNGSIKGLGPRYCPSIEDKINRFAERERHQIFVEPEGWNTVEMYINGFSTSLPQDVQYKALRKIPGFGQARMFRPGYAIEYDYFPPTQLQASLETKLVEGLFFAGQINGTTGYEEAACQGLIAGANAHLKVNERQPLVLGRSQAYMGVLIDDLINKGTDEPYRMFTSRAEYRILLRQDNADIRLSEIALRHGMIGPQRYAQVEQKMRNVEELTRFLRQTAAEPDEMNPVLLSYEEAPINQKVKLGSLLLRPGIGLQALAEASDELKAALASYPEEDKEQAEIQWKYQSYIEREEEQARKMANLDHIYLKPEFDYQSIRALSHEGREKLSTMRPASLGQASRLSGVSPADISILMVYLNKGVEWKH